MATTISAQEYLSKAETKLRTFKREWETYTAEVPDKLTSLVRSGMRPSVSSNSSSGRIGVSLSFEANMDAAKRYLEQVKEKIAAKSGEISGQIKQMDKDLQMYLDAGVDGDMFAKLIRCLNDWIAYIPKMTFTVKGDQKVEFDVSDEIIAVKKKWEKVSAAEIRKKEAEKYGVSLADLDRHKAYLDAKSKKATAKTSADMKKAERAFAGLRGYLDSADFEKACAAAAAELKAKEDEEARIRREREEARKREEAERLRKAVEAYEKAVEDTKQARIDYISAKNSELEQKYETVLVVLKDNYEDSANKNKKEVEDASAEKTRMEQELEAAGLFAFGKKKQLRADIEALSEKLRRLANEGREIDAKYESAKAKEKAEYEAALKKVPADADEKFPMPKDPRK